MEIKLRDELAVKYFRNTPEAPNYMAYYIAIGVSLFLFLVGNSRGSGMRALFLLLGIAGLIISIRKFLIRRNKYTADYKWSTPKATDQQMDQWLDEGKRMVINEARKRLDLEELKESTYPLLIDGPANKTLMGKGNDRILRFKRHNMLVIFLSEHQVATFHCTLDLGLGDILEDHTKEFPYKDITNLETHTSNDEFHFRDGERIALKGIQALGLYTSGANVIAVNYFYSKNTSTNPDEYIYPPSDAEDTIRAIRKRLKEYKDKFSNDNGQP
jgi:hypothetical protein